MKCPSCGYPESRVTDSRPIEEGASIRRRRECISCGKRFTTFEVVDLIQVIVRKKDGTKEMFDRSKLLGRPAQGLPETSGQRGGYRRGN